jgi:hypothetical protein
MEQCKRIDRTVLTHQRNSANTINERKYRGERCEARNARKRVRQQHERREMRKTASEERRNRCEREKRGARIESRKRKQNAIQIGLKTRNTQQPQTEKGSVGRSD